VEPTVRPAAPGEFDRLGAVLGRAFADDPIWTWVYPRHDRQRRLATMFGALLRATAARRATILTDDGLRSAAIWQRSDARSLGPAGNVRMGLAMARGRARMGRGMALLREGERRHPAAPHWYLAVLGTDPAHQGKGLGSALLRHVLDDPANEHDAAHLETETGANVAFYHRYGFVVTDEFDVPRGGPHIWLMWRDATGPSG
jgi:ribosomal protein S18 acetylase RimI-like enzyme